MDFSAVSQSATQGLQRGLEAIKRNSATIADVRNDGEDREKLRANEEVGVKPQPNQASQGSPAPVDDYKRTEALVQLRENEQQFEASAEVLRRSDKALGSLVDTFA